jgi:uncharacterized membrane protein
MMHEIAVTLLVTLSPISELRGGIPLGILHYGLDPLPTFIMAVVANALLFFPIFWVLTLFYDRLLYRLQILNHLLDMVRRRAGPKVAKYGFLGLTLLVAVPLPVTGVYTASILSWLLGMNWRRAFPAIGLGVLIAGGIVLLMTLHIAGRW